ncbi:5298_t:CDS:1, partial [Dentiscutata heterogama]
APPQNLQKKKASRPNKRKPALLNIGKQAKNKKARLSTKAEKENKDKIFCLIELLDRKQRKPGHYHLLEL